ncbi:MAG TPA: RidA family protein [Stellaceae bacterium]|nr:RidA family protein [Stellaceae bacterium]
MKIHNPAASAPPNGPYSLGVEIPAGQRLLFIAGQIPLAKDGSTPQGVTAQAELVWRNIIAVLESAGMGVENLIKINQYLTKAENIPGYGAVRSKVLGAARPASTMVVVQSLVKPEWLVEVEANAAR